MVDVRSAACARERLSTITCHASVGPRPPQPVTCPSFLSSHRLYPPLLSRPVGEYQSHAILRPSLTHSSSDSPERGCVHSKTLKARHAASCSFWTSLTRCADLQQKPSLAAYISPNASAPIHSITQVPPSNTAKLSPILLNRTSRLSFAGDPRPRHLSTSPASNKMSLEAKEARRRRSSSLVYKEPPESLEQLSDQSALPNLNAEWVNAKGEFGTQDSSA